MMVLLMGEIFNYAIDIVSGAVIYVPSFIKIGSGMQKLIRGIHRQQGVLISLNLFFQNKEIRLKWVQRHCIYDWRIIDF
jgi:hypothetical protein